MAFSYTSLIGLWGFEQVGCGDLFKGHLFLSGMLRATRTPKISTGLWEPGFAAGKMGADSPVPGSSTAFYWSWQEEGLTVAAGGGFCKD